MTTNLLDHTPAEILAEILSYLKLADLAVCKQACRRLCEAAEYIISVQYAEELENEGFQDAGGPLDNEEKLRRLEAYKHFWMTGEGDLVETFTVPNTRLMELALSTTVLALTGASNDIVLRQISSRVFGVPCRQWTLGPFPFLILSLAVDPAQELLIVTSRPTLEDPRITLHFLSSETGKEHPSASVSSMEYPVPRYDYQDCTGYVRCNMVIHKNTVGIIFKTIAGQESSEGLQAINWTSGELLMDVRGNVSGGLAFVDGRYIIVYSFIHGCERSGLLVFDITHPPPLQLDLLDPNLKLSHHLVVLELPAPPAGHLTSHFDDTIWASADHAYPDATSPPFTRDTAEDLVAVHSGLIKSTPGRCNPDSPLFRCSYCTGRTTWLALPKPALRDILSNAAATALRPAANTSLRRVPWRTWGARAGAVETNGWKPHHPPVSGSRLFLADRADTAIHDFRAAPLCRDPTLAHGASEETILDGVVQRVPYRRTTQPLPGRAGEADMKLMVGTYFMIVPRPKSPESPPGQRTYDIFSV